MRLLHLFIMFIVASTLSLGLNGCAADRLSSSEARKRISELGTSKLVPDAIEIRRIISQGSNEAIAESTVTLAFQFKKDAKSGAWQVESIRLGDKDWVDVSEILAAVNDGRKRSTLASLQKLADGIEAFRKVNGALPPANDVVKLTDTLHPQYMNDVIRVDGWGRQLEYQPAGNSFRLFSAGADGIKGTTDDIVVSEGQPGRP